MSQRITRAAAVAAATLVAGQALAQQATWTIDTAHSSAQFSVRHMMVATVRGEFANTKGTVRWDGKDLATAVVDATIDATTINTREPKRDAHLRSADFFDVEKFPTLTFKSTRVEPVSPGRLRMTGDLTIHGVTKSVVFDVEGPTPAIKDNRRQPARRRVGHGDDQPQGLRPDLERRARNGRRRGERRGEDHPRRGADAAPGRPRP